MSPSTRARALLFPPLLASLLVSGCAEWPRYANLPTDDIEGFPAGTNPADAVDIDWAAAEREADPGNETPPATASVELGAGRLFYGSLDASGWDSTVDVDHQVLCGDQVATSDFPPIEQGTYTGDIDWVSVTPSADGVLCVALDLSLDDSLPVGFAYDLLLYDLDDCGNPLTMHVDDAGQPLGEALYQDQAGWSEDVVGGAALGVVLAGFIPGELISQQLAWRLGVSLVPPAPDGDTLCPSLPEAQ